MWKGVGTVFSVFFCCSVRPPYLRIQILYLQHGKAEVNNVFVRCVIVAKQCSVPLDIVHQVL
jgi:hypothetical protein